MPIHGLGGTSVSLGCQCSIELEAIAVSRLPPLKDVTLIRIDQAGSSAPPSGFWKGAMGQPSLHRSSCYANPGANVGCRQPLVTQFKHLLIAIQFLRPSSKTSLFLATRASRALFFFQPRVRLFSRLH